MDTQLEVSRILGLEVNSRNGQLRKDECHGRTSYLLNIDGINTLGVTFDGSMGWSDGCSKPVLETAKIMSYLNSHMEPLPSDLKVLNGKEFLKPKVGTFSVCLETPYGFTVLTKAFAFVMFQGYDSVYHVGDAFSIRDLAERYPYSFEKAIEELESLSSLE